MKIERSFDLSHCELPVSGDETSFWRDLFSWREAEATAEAFGAWNPNAKQLLLSLEDALLSIDFFVS